METLSSSNTLLDILGVLIGFAAVMLLLSLLVTSMVQLIQACLQLRAGNLIKGIRAALEDAGVDRGKRAEELAKKLIVKPTSESRLDINATPSYFDRVSWIEPDELAKRSYKIISEKEKEKGKETAEITTIIFIDRFKSIQTFMSKRFALISRITSIGCAVVIAILFQVNALALLRDLSANAKMREQYVVGAEKLLPMAATATRSALSYQEVSDLALTELAVKHPQLDSVLEEVSGVGESREEVIQELREVMADKSPALIDTIATEYEDILDSLYQGQATKAKEQIDQLMGMTSYFNLQIWPHGGGFFNNPTNWLGSIITIILVSLGAPFWFNLLRFLSGLRDALKPKEPEKKE